MLTVKTIFASLKVKYDLQKENYNFSESGSWEWASVRCLFLIGKSCPAFRSVPPAGANKFFICNVKRVKISDTSNHFDYLAAQCDRDFSEPFKSLKYFPKKISALGSFDSSVSEQFEVGLVASPPFNGF